MDKAKSFSKSARAIHKLLVDRQDGLGIDPHHVLNLFDSDLSADDQLIRMKKWFKQVIDDSLDEERPIEDAILYYIGHGSPDSDQSLTLLLRNSEKGFENPTGLNLPDLARLLKRSLFKQRYFIVLDCCFSESAARSFMGPREEAITASAVRGFRNDLPRRGGLLLCACPADEVAIGPPDAPMTAFSGALFEVLRHGDERLPEEFSFNDLRDAIEDKLYEHLGTEAPRPTLHPVNQRDGDLTRVPAFSNKAHFGSTDRPPADPTQSQLDSEQSERAKAVEAKAQADRDAAERARALEAKAQADRDAAERAKARVAREAKLREARESTPRERAELFLKGREKSSQPHYFRIAPAHVLMAHLISAIAPVVVGLFSVFMIEMLHMPEVTVRSDYLICWLIAVVPQWPSMFYLLRKTSNPSASTVVALCAPLVSSFIEGRAVALGVVGVFTAMHVVLLFVVRSQCDMVWEGLGLIRRFGAIKGPTIASFYGAARRLDREGLTAAEVLVVIGLSLFVFAVWTQTSILTAKQYCKATIISASASQENKLFACAYDNTYIISDLPDSGSWSEDLSKREIMTFKTDIGASITKIAGRSIFAYAGRQCDFEGRVQETYYIDGLDVDSKELPNDCQWLP